MSLEGGEEGLDDFSTADAVSHDESHVEHSDDFLCPVIALISDYDSEAIPTVSPIAPLFNPLYNLLFSIVPGVPILLPEA